MKNEYPRPKGIEGIGSDIKWCSRQKGRKKCNLCFNYTNKETWMKDWHWFYLHTWSEHWFGTYHAHHKVPKYYLDFTIPRYTITGLTEAELRKILNKGCNLNKKCKCINIAQRAFWYCHNCYNAINIIAKMENSHPHDIMIFGYDERNELKSKILILRLSGSI